MSTMHLHIGSPKTGSTSVQHNLRVNDLSLKKNGYIYPGKTEDQQLLYFAGKANYQSWPRKFKSIGPENVKRACKEFFKAFEKEVQNYFEDDYDIISSSEYLFEYDENHVVNLVNYLKNFFSTIKVYLYVRDPIEYYRSYEQQGIKHRSYIKNPWLFKYPFRQVIDIWSKYSDLTVIKYSKEKDSFQSFLEELGLKLSDYKTQHTGLNSSISIEQMLLLEKVQYHLYSNKDNRFKNHLSPIIYCNSSYLHKPELMDCIKPILYKVHLEDIKWLNKNYRIDLLNQQYELYIGDQLNLRNRGKKVSVRDVFRIPDEKIVNKFEAKVLDELLKELQVQRLQN